MVLFRVARLKSKALIKFTGPESVPFLQGLTTNDLSELSNVTSNTRKSLYTLFLNSKGRVLNDALLYWSQGEILVEVDTSLANPLLAHLHTYRLRRKVEIIPWEEEVWAVWGNEAAVFEGAFHDPRLKELGLRFILPKGTSFTNHLDSKGVMVEESEDHYRALRYSLGVGEGAAEINWASSFPLENNCDYLGGVSFHKGCYIGQELTARTHHTGVVRKRLMPLFFQDENVQVPIETPVEADGKKIGKVKGHSMRVGLALLRVSEALKAQLLKIGDYNATTQKPHWWPPDK